MKIIGDIPDLEKTISINTYCINCHCLLEINTDDLKINKKTFIDSDFLEFVCLFCKKQQPFAESQLSKQDIFIIKNKKQLGKSQSIEEKKGKRFSKFLKWSFT